MAMFDSEFAKEFYFKGNNTGVLLIHGFTGSPAEMRYLGDYLKDKGFTVQSILLKGHGTSLFDMRKTNHKDWLQSALSAYQKLKLTCDEIFVVGFSMGGALALNLAVDCEISGIVSLSTPIKVLKIEICIRRLLQCIKNKFEKKPAVPDNILLSGYKTAPLSCIKSLFKLIKQVKTNLNKVQVPILIVHSYGDKTANPMSANIIYKKIGSKDKSIIYLHKSGHLVTCECEKEQVFDEVYNFIKRRTKAQLMKTMEV